MKVVLLGLLLGQAAPAESAVTPTAATPPAAAPAATKRPPPKVMLKAPGLAILAPGLGKKREPKKAKPRMPEAPKVPEGMQQCLVPLAPSVEMPRGAGETVRYVVDVNGLSLGTIDFKIERNGTFSGTSVTEYRSLFKLDGLVSTFMPVEGRAAALVPSSSFSPLSASSHYTLDKSTLVETQTFTKNGASVTSKRTRDGKDSDDERLFPGPATDFVSAFYFLRSLPAGSSGCVIIYGNQRGYTIWLKPDGKEGVKTPVGFKEADRIAIIYASDRAKTKSEGHVWIGTSAERLPYKAELIGRDKLEARVHLYQNAGGP